MKISLNWLREFVDIPESINELRAVMDDLGLVVEGIEYLGEGLEDVIVARIDEIRAIEGADRVRLVIADAGDGPIEIVCGATNFALGNYVPLAPVGAVLPGGFAIAQRKMRGVTSNGMLCSARELQLSDDHEGLMILDDLIEPHVGEHLVDALHLTSDVVFDISVEGNRPDGHSIEGMARDLAARFERPLREPALAVPSATEATSTYATVRIDAPDLCGRFTASVIRNVKIGPSPSWIAQRLQASGMRPISNVVDASNFVMLELGQPTHPYDADHVAGQTLAARRARPGETLKTLDGVERELAKQGRGLGDTGEDCVIVDGNDQVLGLGGIMGGAASEISDTTTTVLLEAAYFDSMVVARSSKRHGLRTEASNRYEKGVDPSLGLRAAARFVEILSLSVPDVEWMAEPLDVIGAVPELPVIELRDGDVKRLLGVDLETSEVVTILRSMDFDVVESGDTLSVTPPSRRLDIRAGVLGRADVIEEIARLHGYGRFPRHRPSWPEPGGLTERQQLRRHLRDAIVDAGALEAWTPSLGSDADFDLLHAGQPRVRITNPLTADEAVLRATLITGLLRAWSRNVERGVGDVILAEFGVVFLHPEASAHVRTTRGGVGGALELELPNENERLTMILGRPQDDASSAVALWHHVAQRLGLSDVVVRASSEAQRGLHPTRTGALVDRNSGALVGYVGEVDSELVEALTPGFATRRVGIVDIDLDVLADASAVARRSPFVTVPSRFPSAVLDLALVTPDSVNAGDLGHALRTASDVVESVDLFDVYRGASLPEGSRSLAFSIRLSSSERTLSDEEIVESRQELLKVAGALGATLR